MLKENAASLRVQEKLGFVRDEEKHYSPPAMYYGRAFTDLGGLIAYSPDYFGGFAPAAGYVDRIVKGAKPGDLPVQAPTKFELSINLKTAKALGVTTPPTVTRHCRQVNRINDPMSPFDPSETLDRRSCCFAK